MFKRGTWQDLTTFLQCYLANWASSSLNFSQNGTSPRLLSKQNVLYFLKYWADGQFQTICIEMKKDLHRHIIFLVMNMLTLEHILPLAQCYNCETCTFHVIILLLKLTGKLLSFFFFSPERADKQFLKHLCCIISFFNFVWVRCHTISLECFQEMKLEWLKRTVFSNSIYAVVSCEDIARCAFYIFMNLWRTTFVAQKIHTVLVAQLIITKKKAQEHISILYLGY